MGLSVGDDGEVVLTLTLSLHGVWNPEVVFSLQPVGLKKIDILEAQVRDLQEENIQLKAKVELDLIIPFFSVSSMAACSAGDIVKWNSTAPREITASRSLRHV